jgi:hypothetical protein
MSRTLTRNLKIDLLETEYVAEITFDFYRARSGSSVEPPEGPAALVSDVTLRDKAGKVLPMPDWLHELIADSEWIADELIDYASEDA